MLQLRSRSVLWLFAAKLQENRGSAGIESESRNGGLRGNEKAETPGTINEKWLNEGMRGMSGK